MFYSRLSCQRPPKKMESIEEILSILHDDKLLSRYGWQYDFCASSQCFFTTQNVLSCTTTKIYNQSKLGFTPFILLCVTTSSLVRTWINVIFCNSFAAFSYTTSPTNMHQNHYSSDPLYKSIYDSYLRFFRLLILMYDMYIFHSEKFSFNFKWIYMVIFFIFYLFVNGNLCSVHDIKWMYWWNLPS